VTGAVAKGHPMTKMIQTPSGHYIHPQDYVQRRRWASASPRPR
jgi:hypothetical protein